MRGKSVERSCLCKTKRKNEVNFNKSNYVRRLLIFYCIFINEKNLKHNRRKYCIE